MNRDLSRTIVAAHFGQDVESTRWRSCGAGRRCGPSSPAAATSASVTPPVGEAAFGTLEAGKIADLVVLDADPLEDIRNTLAIDRVMKVGSGLSGRGCLPVR